ncbi:MAG: acetyl-CoA synthetase [Halolamina sp.]|uniref:acetyl-CoA synthetase n=1 Tax=Halolamina sp. TaxID=1940283 RepID=UPI002FC296AB
MEILADLVARDRRSDAPALHTPDRAMDYRRVCTTTWKASNYLRHLGVGGDRGIVAIATHSPPPLLTFFGAALLDTPTRFVDDVTDLPAAIDTLDARAVLVPVALEAAVDPPAGTTLAVHGGEPTAPTTENWEEGVWSENPAFVPSTATPESVALETSEQSVSHGELLDAATTVATTLALDAGETVAVDSSLADPRAVAAVLAPLTVGGCAVLGKNGDVTTTVGRGDLDGLVPDW